MIDQHSAPVWPRRAGGALTIGLAAVVVSITFASGLKAQALLTARQAEAGQAAELRPDSLEIPSPDRAAISVVVPTGKVWVGPGQLDGELRYARRIKTKEGVTIVEASATPSMSVSPDGSILAPRPEELPASW